MPDRDPRGQGRGARRVFGRKYRSRLSLAHQYIFVGLALVFLLAWFLFRDSCSRRIGETFGIATERPTRDAGVDARPRPKADPEDW
jgi:hypothetical protein